MENEILASDCMGDQNILIDRLEDAFIDHPSATAGTSQYSDESFQHKLNERANQIQQDGEWTSASSNDPYVDQNTNTASYQFLPTKPNLLYKHTDRQDLAQELDQWFVTSDFSVIGLAALKRAKSLTLDLHAPPDLASISLWQHSQWLELLTYLALGEFGETSGEAVQLECIKSNCLSILSLKSFVVVAELLNTTLAEISAMAYDDPSRAFSKAFSSNYMRLLTIFYFLISVALDSERAFDQNLLILSEVDLLSTIVKLCEAWKINSIPQMRIRNCLLLHWKLILFELGGSKQISLTDEYLVEKHNVEKIDRKRTSKKLTCSRIEYFTFEEDLQDKFPMKKKFYDEAVSSFHLEDHQDSHRISTLFLDKLSLSQERELFMANKLHSNSLSNFIEIPRTNKLHSVYGTLPGNTVHIATPVPSPPTTPSEFMSGGEKVRKLYHVNQGLPFVYPVEGDENIPEAINEASRLIEDGVYESYLAKRLSYERNLFLSAERGNKPAYPEDSNNMHPGKNSLKSAKLDECAATVRSLNRTEKYYRSVLSHLRGFVDVLVNVIKTSKIEVRLRDIEKELDPGQSFTKRFGDKDNSDHKILGVMYHQLDIIRAKETTLKAVSAILILTLRWFKLSSPLKSYYLSSLLFDARYLNVFVEFLADSFNNSALQNFATENKGMQIYDVLSSQNRLLNSTFNFPQLSFFKECHGMRSLENEKHVLVNKTPLDKLPHKLDNANKRIVNITKFNHDFCFILVNMLCITQKVLIKNILQRVFVFNDTKPTELLKIILLNYVNDELRRPILKIFKRITPYQGRKWRALNMDVISLIYLHMKLSLKDNWLSGKDLENEFKDSLEQEISLRSFLQFYNVRNYPEEMRYLGYESRNRSSTC